MTRHRPAKSRARAQTRGVLSQALIFLTLIAFTLQGFVTQTHIHARPVGAPAVVDLFDGAKDTGPGKAPVKSDESNCPLCQAFASAGHFVTPAVAATLQPTFAISIIALVVRATNPAPQASHAWRGRAPPLG